MTMLSMFKKIMLFLLVGTSVVCQAQQNKEVVKGLFATSYGGTYLFSNTDVMKAYIGSWSGAQTIKFGEQTARGRIDINYSPTIENGALKIIGIGKVSSGSGRSVPIASYMYISNGILILEMRTASGIASFYKGTIDSRSVIWTPLYDFMSYDFQQDFFYIQDGVDCINAVGAREFNYQGNFGFLEIITQFKKLSSSKPASSVNTSIQKNIKVNIGGGKFGK